MMLKLKLQYFGHLMRRVDSLEKTLMLGGIGGRRRRGRHPKFVAQLRLKLRPSHYTIAPTRLKKPRLQPKVGSGVHFKMFINKDTCFPRLCDGLFRHEKLASRLKLASQWFLNPIRHWVSNLCITNHSRV